jgi:hypothetical protein
MMVVLNSRMVYGITNDTVSNKLSLSFATVSRRFSTSQAGVSMSHEQWSNPPASEHQLEDFKVVSVAIKTLMLSILNLEDRQL